MATFKGKDNFMLHIWSIFLPLRVAPTRIENDFKGHLNKKPPKLNYANYVSISKSPCFDADTLGSDRKQNIHLSWC